MRNFKNSKPVQFMGMLRSFKISSLEGSPFPSEQRPLDSPAAAHRRGTGGAGSRSTRYRATLAHTCFKSPFASGTEAPRHRCTSRTPGKYRPSQRDPSSLLEEATRHTHPRPRRSILHWLPSHPDLPRFADHTPTSPPAPAAAASRAPLHREAPRDAARTVCADFAPLAASFTSQSQTNLVLKAAA